MDDIEATVREFIKTIDNDDDICNEAELQFRLGVFIRDHLPDSKIYFERSLNNNKFKIDYDKNTHIKKEIDLVIQKGNEKPSAIELKYPKNGAVPDTMYHFIEDIKFLEQLIESNKFQHNLFLAIVEDSKFWSGKANGEVYPYFRANEKNNLPAKKDIFWPTGTKNIKNHINLNKSYPTIWELVPNNHKKRFLLIEVN